MLVKLRLLDSTSDDVWDLLHIHLVSLGADGLRFQLQGLFSHAPLA